MICCEEDGQAVQVVPGRRHHLPLLSMVRHTALAPLSSSPSFVSGCRLQAVPQSSALCLSLFLLCLSRSHLALHDELVSKAFQGRHGRAFLFGNVSAKHRTHSNHHSLTHSSASAAINPSTSRATHRLCPVSRSLSVSINVTLGPSENRILMTGLHTVCDIYCLVCCDAIGWYYMEAFEESEKYKEKKFIVEKAKITKETLT